jgi:thioredoxin
MTVKTQIIRCQNCRTKNRLRVGSKSPTVCGKCKKEISFPATPVLITDANFVELVEQSAMPVLLDLWATWCPPCRQLAPIIDKVAEDLSGRAIIGKLDVDKNQQTAARFGVQSIPTLLIFKDGREVERIVGLQSKEAIIHRLNKYL